MKELGMARSVFTASAVAVALVLAGCGGGGDSDDRADRADAAVAGLEATIAQLTMDLATANGEVTRLEGELSTANGNVTRLEGELSTANGNVTRLEGELSTANGDVMRLEGELADAGGENTRLMGELATANGEVTRLTGELTAANGEVTRLEGELADETKRADDLQAQIDAAGDVRAIAKAKAVNAALRDDDADVDAPTVSASTEGVLSAKATGYEDAGEAPDVGGLPSGWRGRLLTKDDNMLVVYSDIGDAVGTPLGALYDSSISDGVRSYNVSRGDDTSSIMWGHVTRPDGVLSTETSGTPAVTTTSFRGSVRGAAGTFVCTAADCNAPTRNSDGTVTADANVGTVWSFQPDDPSALASVADTSYVSVGWSLIANTDGTYEYDAFATSTGMEHTDETDGTTNVVGTNLTGSASYTGGAAGKYSLLDEIEDTAHGGHWTATAELTANFDADADGDATNNLDGDGDRTADSLSGVSVTGTIAGFMVDGASQPEWKVTLGAADIGAVGTAGTQTPANTAPAENTNGDAVSGAATWSRGGAASGTGEWNYTFYGPVGDATAGWRQPAGITGGFDAMVGNRAYIEGAFAAQQDEDE